VTCIPAPGDSNDYWLIKPLHESSWNAMLGKEVQNGERITLGHFETAQNLHSHSGVMPPVTRGNNYQVNPLYLRRECGIKFHFHMIHGN
jgi:dolichyl-phosphate-mannose--protein O-mannosyl transferase